MDCLHQLLQPVTAAEQFDVEQKLPALTPEPEPAPELPLPDISSDTFLHHSEDTLPSPPVPSDEAFFNGAPF